MLNRADLEAPFDWCRFFYSSSNNLQNILQSKIHGTRSTTDETEKFILTANERINKVQVVVDDVTLIISGVEQSVQVVRGVRLFTTQGRQSSSIDYIDGEISTEQFDGYTVKYVTGRKGLMIDQLQFYWVLG